LLSAASLRAPLSVMTGREAPAAAGIFRTKTGSLWIFAFQQNHWASSCEVMGRPELINDPRCSQHNGRVANRGFVNAEITKWLMTLPEMKRLWRS
jgi:crotonobetainyl-CoA:carnitine CoA-transferase CaiB-like acyl-CoA transferase